MPHASLPIAALYAPVVTNHYIICTYGNAQLLLGNSAGQTTL